MSNKVIMKKSVSWADLCSYYFSFAMKRFFGSLINTETIELIPKFLFELYWLNAKILTMHIVSKTFEIYFLAKISCIALVLCAENESVEVQTQRIIRLRLNRAKKFA